jgi:hypothetical protein
VRRLLSQPEVSALICFVYCRELSQQRDVGMQAYLSLVKVLIDCEQASRALDQIIRYIHSPTALNTLLSFNDTSLLPVEMAEPAAAIVDSEQISSEKSHKEIHWQKPLFAAIHTLGKNYHWDTTSDLLQRCHFIAKGQYTYQSQYDHELASLISPNADSPITSETSTIFRASELAPEVRRELSSAMPLLFDSAARASLRSTTGLHYAISLIQLQKNLGIIPTWGCVRTALAATFTECKWKSCLRLFSSRKNCSNYLPGDETTYHWAVRAAGALKQWALALELWAELLNEKPQPGPSVVESVIEILLKNNQGPFVIEVIKLMADRGIPRTRKMYSMIHNDKILSEGLKSKLYIQLALSKTDGAPENTPNPTASNSNSSSNSNSGVNNPKKI